jgi:hypothetical protein
MSLEEAFQCHLRNLGVQEDDDECVEQQQQQTKESDEEDEEECELYAQRDDRCILRYELTEVSDDISGFAYGDEHVVFCSNFDAAINHMWAVLDTSGAYQAIEDIMYSTEESDEREQAWSALRRTCKQVRLHNESWEGYPRKFLVLNFHSEQYLTQCKKVMLDLLMECAESGEDGFVRFSIKYMDNRYPTTKTKKTNAKT